MNNKEELKVWFLNENNEKKWGYVSKDAWDLYLLFKDEKIENKVINIYVASGNVENVFLSEIKLLPEFAKVKRNVDEKEPDIGNKKIDFKVLDLKLFSE